MSNSGYRTANRFVQYDIELTDPVVWTDSREGSRPVSVESVRLRFGHGDDGFFVEANLQGPYLSRTGKSLKSRADDYAGPPDLWPAWLTALADEHRPEGYVTRSGPLLLDPEREIPDENRAATPELVIETRRPAASRGFPGAPLGA